MALTTDEGALVVVADLVPGLAPVALKIFDLRRDHEAQFHRLHVMTGGAGDRGVIRHLVGKLLEILQRVVPAHRVEKNVFRIGALTGDAGTVLLGYRRALRTLDVLERIDMAAVIVVVHGKGIALPVFDHLRLVHESRMDAGTSVACRGRRIARRHLVRFVFERICLLESFHAEMGIVLRRYLSELDGTRWLGDADAHDDEAEERNADNDDAQQTLLQLTQL